MKLLTVLLIVATACSRETPRGATDIVIGEFGSMTGPQATFGQSTHNGIVLALEEINSAGGVIGRKLALITEDDQSRQDEAANAVTKLISQNQVIAIIGEVASSASLAAAPVCQSAKVPMITPSSTNAGVTATGDYIFRMCFVDNYQGPVMAHFASRDLGKRRAAILTDVRNDYSTGLAVAIEQVFTEDGGRIVARRSYSNGDSDFRPQLTALRGEKPDVIFIPGYYTDVGQIVSQARELGITVPFVGGDGWESPKLLEIGGSALEGCFYANHYHSDDPAPIVQDFVRRYTKRYGSRPDSLAALAYDSTRVLADAIRRAGSTEAPAVRNALATTRDFAGVTGKITMGPLRDPIGKKIVIEEIRGGRVLLRATIDPAAAVTSP